MIAPTFSAPLLTVLGPLSCEQVAAIAEMYPDSYIRQVSAVTVDCKARAVFEIVNAEPNTNTPNESKRGNIISTPNSTIINTLRILARDIESEDGVANAALQEAAGRFCELVEQCSRAQKLMAVAAQRLEYSNVYGCDHDSCSSAEECDVVARLIAKLRKEVQA